MLRNNELKTNHVQTAVLKSFFFGTYFNFLLFNIFYNAIMVFNKVPLRDPNFPNTDVHDGYILLPLRGLVVDALFFLYCITNDKNDNNRSS